MTPKKDTFFSFCFLTCFALVSSSQIRFTAFYEGQLERATCPQLLLRGYSKAGLWAVTAADVLDCTDTKRASPRIVIDANREWGPVWR